MSKLARWICPKCKDGKLAPARARRDDTRTYCLACSADSPKLVRRVCPKVEKKREAKKAKARAKARANYVFKAREPGYYNLAGAHAYELIYRWGPWNHATVGKILRVRNVKGPHSVVTKRSSAEARASGNNVTITVYRWPGMTAAWDGYAQAILAVTQRFSPSPGSRAWIRDDSPSSRAWIRDTVERRLGVRPSLLGSMSKAEEEIAGLLQAKAACAALSQAEDTPFWIKSWGD